TVRREGAPAPAPTLSPAELPIDSATESSDPCRRWSLAKKDVAATRRLEFGLSVDVVGVPTSGGDGEDDQERRPVEERAIMLCTLGSSSEAPTEVRAKSTRPRQISTKMLWMTDTRF